VQLNLVVAAHLTLLAAPTVLKSGLTRPTVIEVLNQVVSSTALVGWQMEKLEISPSAAEEQES
jgi:hypothetical protein